jgi:hypothetical protein
MSRSVSLRPVPAGKGAFVTGGSRHRCRYRATPGSFVTGASLGIDGGFSA